MGKKGLGRKAFVKSTMSRHEEDESDASQAPSEANVAPGAAVEGEAVMSVPAQTKEVAALVDKADKFRIAVEEPPAPSQAPSGGEVTEGGSPDDSGEAFGPSETRGQMVQRHKMEVKRMKEQAKSLRKKKKDEAARLEKELDARQTAELQAWDAAHAGHQQAPAGESTAASELHQEAKQSGKTVTRAQKRRQQRAAEDAERDARIARELAEGGDSARILEERTLAERLAPEGLAIYEIPADGHCMYRSVEHQLPAAQYSYMELRAAAAAFMRAHPDQFLPYLTEEDAISEDEDGEEGQPQEGGGAESSLSSARFQRYCARVEGTAAWGGQLELQALAHTLKRGIKVYSADMDVVDIGSEYIGDNPPLKVCYLRHAYGLGEHYNSVKPVESSDEEF